MIFCNIMHNPTPQYY